MSQNATEKWHLYPDHSKKRLYYHVARLPFYILIGICFFVYLNYLLTFVLPNLFGYYTLENFEEYHKNAEKASSFIQFDSILNNIKTETQKLDKNQYEALKMIIIVHILGALFLWSLIKVKYTGPGHIPSEYKQKEVQEIARKAQLIADELKREIEIREETEQLQKEQNSQENLEQMVMMKNPSSVIKSQQTLNDSEVKYDGNDQFEEYIRMTRQCGYQYEVQSYIQNQQQTYFQEHIKAQKIRICKRCFKNKPMRTHHCSQCKKCIIKMDHHCQWVDTCIGFFNYKYFVLLIFYASCCLLYIDFTYLECYLDSIISHKASFLKQFYIALVFYFTLTLSVAVFGFFLFHLWLILTNKTTVEWCENKDDSKKGQYSKGCFKNFSEVMNTNPIFWCMPINPNYNGEGLQYENTDNND